MKFFTQSLFAVAALISNVSAAPGNLEARGVGIMRYDMFVKSLPEGMTFSLTECNLIKSEIGLGGTSLQHLPVTVTPKQNGGRLGDVSMRVDASSWHGNLGVSGEGARWEMRFTISGRDSRGGATSRSGRITIATTAWGEAGRPDYSIISYYFDGSAPQAFQMATPNFSDLHNIHFAFSYDKKTKAMALAITDDAPMTTRIAEYAVNGILWAHERAFRWAVGAAWTELGLPSFT